MSYFLLFLFVPILFMMTIPVYKPPDTERAYTYAKNYLIAYYHQHRDFPNSLSIPRYPFIRYTKRGSATTSNGIPDGNQARVEVVFAGEDRLFGTADDRVLSLTASMLETDRYEDLYRRANVLEQAAYAICQRRYAQGISPIWPQNLDEVIRNANLPAGYKYTPFGATYIYDLSSCLTNSCYCTQAIVKAP